MRADGNTSIEKLLSIGSEPLARRPETGATALGGFPLSQHLFELLLKKNGFYAFESALHVFPLAAQSSSGFTLEQWNSVSLWRNEYKGLAEGLLFFAEDAFQDQFCLSSNGILHFISETGQTSYFADSFENWAKAILSDYGVHTGWPILNRWQELQGPLLPGKRLMPKIPFFLGGRYDLDNLWAGDAVEGMRFKANIAMQTRNLPDGGQVRLMVGERTKSNEKT